MKLLESPALASPLMWRNLGEPVPTGAMGT